MKKYGTTFYEDRNGNRVAISYISNGNYLTSKCEHIRKIGYKWHILDPHDKTLCKFPTLKKALLHYLNAYNLHEIP